MAVAARGAFEYALAPTPLDDPFIRAVGHRDDRELLFPTCVDPMATVVCRVKPSVHAAYQADDYLPVNVTAAHARRPRVPTTAGRERMRHTAERLGPVIRATGGAGPDLITRCRTLRPPPTRRSWPRATGGPSSPPRSPPR